MKKRLRLPLATVVWCAAIALLPASLRAQQIINGGFELSPASTTVSNAGLGWTQTVQGLCYVYAYGSADNTYGSQYLYISGGGVTQTIPGPFVVGAPYEISFAARDTMSGTVPTIGISLSGGATAYKTFSLPRLGPYVTCTLDFTPTSAGAVTLTIGGNPYPAAIDNVVLVPEPSTWALLGVGATGIGALAWRRRRAASIPSTR